MAFAAGRAPPVWFPALAAASGMAAPVVALACILLALQGAPWFDWWRHNLSDLGVREGAAPLFNGGLIVAGLAGLPFATLLHERAGRDAWRARGAQALAAGFVLLALVGVFPQDVRPWHGVAGFGFFILAPLGAMVYGAGELRSGSARYGAFGIAVGFAALVSFFSLLGVLLALGLKYAIAEMVHAALLAAWAMVSAARLWVRL